MNNRGFDFSNVDVVLADSLPASRNTLRSILADLGFRRVVVCGNIEQVRTILQEDPVDLLMVDTELPVGDTCQFVHDMRHNRESGDPFLPVLATTWQPTEDVVRKAVGAGIDAILTLPASLESMKEGLAKMVTMRKPFVVTSEYIGPDRRKTRRGQEQKIPLIDVPNPVRAKALGSQDNVNHRACMNFINEQKVERHAYTVGLLVKEVDDQFTSRQKKKNVEEVLLRLRTVSSDLVSRIQTTRYSEHTEHCRTLALTVDELDLRDAKKVKHDLENLTDMALAVELAVHADRQGFEEMVCVAEAAGPVPSSFSRIGL